MADMRVSNALVINSQRKRDSFIKRVLDDAHIDYGKKKLKGNLFDKKTSEGLLFEDNAPLIEMIPRNPMEEKKEDEEGFETFYEGYGQRTTSVIDKAKPKRKNTYDPKLRS